MCTELDTLVMVYHFGFLVTFVNREAKQPSLHVLLGCFLKKLFTDLINVKGFKKVH